ncbi:hypothetical protein U5922_001085 [Aquicoccus sp. G2-2]|uniref:hypothetical protein n=1 Tax=Aquicoccus sp. G2-2 TaxID=3092120 RepID=UPI002ADF996E|nr:hypothetical protein [Aquicoccus sp. G2-2]MEA1112123.1 hypothetical protein [Aquicoccus sp. G2-2]
MTQISNSYGGTADQQSSAENVPSEHFDVGAAVVSKTAPKAVSERPSQPGDARRCRRLLERIANASVKRGYGIRRVSRLLYRIRPLTPL